MIIRMV